MRRNVILSIAAAAAAAAGAGAVGEPRAAIAVERSASRVQATHTYNVKVSYSLRQEAVDPATSLRRTIEWRWAADHPRGVLVNTGNGNVFTWDPARRNDLVSSTGTMSIQVRNEQVTPVCEQSAEAKLPGSLKFVDVKTTTAAATQIFMTMEYPSRELPRPPCSLRDRGRGNVTTGRLTGSVSDENVFLRSVGTFDTALRQKLLAGRLAELLVDLQPQTQQAGVTYRATLRLTFTRVAPEPGSPKPGGPIQLAEPFFKHSQYDTSAFFPLVRAGERVRNLDRAPRCSGRIVGGPAIDEVTSTSFYLLGRNFWGTDEVTARHIALLPGLARFEGKPAGLVVCNYHYESSYAASRKTLRGAITVVVDGRKATRSFSFKICDWQLAKPACIKKWRGR